MTRRGFTIFTAAVRVIDLFRDVMDQSCRAARGTRHFDDEACRVAVLMARHF